MSRPRLGAAPMSSAERQARRRARLRQQRPASPAAPTRRLAPRPARWAAAVATLARLQEEYRDWLDNLPPNLESSALADKLQTIVDLDLEVAGGRPTTRLWSRLMSPLTTKAPYKPAPGLNKGRSRHGAAGWPVCNGTDRKRRDRVWDVWRDLPPARLASGRCAVGGSMKGKN